MCYPITLFCVWFLWGMPSLSKSRISSHPVYLLSWLCYCRAQKEQKGEECGSCRSVIRLAPAFSRGLTSYPGAQFSCVEILMREDVPWSPWVVRSERQPHQCSRPPWRLAAWGPFPVWSPTPLTSTLGDDILCLVRPTWSVYLGYDELEVTTLT